jgi:predicted amidophosphoribosyltransferase
MLLRAIPNRRLDARICPRCRYDLTGNESGICPECGTPTPRHVRELKLAKLAPAAERLTDIVVPEIEAESMEHEIFEQAATEAGELDQSSIFPIDYDQPYRVLVAK